MCYFCPSMDDDPNQIIKQMLYNHYNEKVDVSLREKLFNEKAGLHS